MHSLHYIPSGLMVLILLNGMPCSAQQDEWSELKVRLNAYNEKVVRGDGTFEESMKYLKQYREAYDKRIVRPDYPYVAEFRIPDDPDMNHFQFLHFHRPYLREANVVEYGAVGDGRTLNTDVLNRLIEHIHNEGGGALFFPPGVYLTGSVRLRSNVHLYLSPAATIRSAPIDIFAYAPPRENPHFPGLIDPSRYSYIDVRHCLIWGDDIENVSIYGGTIDGSALPRSSGIDDFPIGGANRSTAIRGGRNIIIKDVHFYTGGHIALQIIDSEDVTLAGIRMRTARDGIQLFGVRNLELYNSDIESIRYEDAEKQGGDDPIVFKSMYGMLGKHVTTDGVIIRDTRIATNAFGLHFGSETTSDFRNIRFENIRIDHADKAGISITVSDGAVIENIHYENITMRNVGTPIWFRIVDRERGMNPDRKRGGVIRNISLKNIRAIDVEQVIRGEDGFTASIVGQADSKVQNIHMENIHITYRGGGTSEMIELVPQDWPEHNPNALGTRPSYGFYIRHAQGVRLKNVRTEYEREDHRPAIVVDNASKITMERLSTQRSDALDFDVLIRENVEGVTVRDNEGVVVRDSRRQ
jgi:polygalacturonase